MHTCYMCGRPYEKACSRSYHRFPRDLNQRNKWFEVLQIQPDFSRYLWLCSDHFLPKDFYIQPCGRRVLKHGAVPYKVPEVNNEITLNTTSSETLSAVETPSKCSRSSSATQTAYSPTETVDTSATETADETEGMSPRSSNSYTVESKIDISENSLWDVCSCQTVKEEPLLVTVKTENSFRNVRYIGDIKIDEIHDLEQMKWVWEKAVEKIDAQKKKIKNLQAQNRRLKIQLEKSRKTCQCHNHKKKEK